MTLAPVSGSTDDSDTWSANDNASLVSLAQVTAMEIALICSSLNIERAVKRNNSILETNRLVDGSPIKSPKKLSLKCN